jgi:hypothetical protein
VIGTFVLMLVECLILHVQDKYVLAETRRKIKRFLARGSSASGTEESFGLSLNRLESECPSPLSNPPEMVLPLPEEPVFTISESYLYSSMSYGPVDNTLQPYPLLPTPSDEADDLLADCYFLEYGDGHIVSVPFYPILM